MVHFLLLYFLHVWYIGAFVVLQLFSIRNKITLKSMFKLILKVCSNIGKISYVKVVLSANVFFIKLLVTYIS
jgi:hypothetical protein